jgi:transcriptional regulator with XRE-family HTH domain
MADFADEVRRHMQARGMSLRGLARAAGYDPSYLSKILSGRKPASPFLVRCLDSALGAGGAIEQAAAQPAARDEQPPAPVPARTWQGPVAPELVDYFRGQLPGHYQADMFLGPRHLIPTVQTQTELIIQLVPGAEAAVRRDLLGVGAAYAALLGWLYQDAGDLASSARWRDVTLALAHRSGDAQLVSYALTNKAMMAVDLGDGHAVVDFAQAALAGQERLCAKVRVLALQHQAHGHAMLGDRTEADRLLDAAETLTGRVDDEYPWGNACRRTPAYVQVQRATCYGRTGRPQDAADAAALWDQILAAIPQAQRRDSAVFHARQAAALAVLPDPERVTSIAAGAAGLVQETGSARLRRELVAVRDQARGWAHTAAGRELGEIIASIA